MDSDLSGSVVCSSPRRSCCLPSQQQQQICNYCHLPNMTMEACVISLWAPAEELVSGRPVPGGTPAFPSDSSSPSSGLSKPVASCSLPFSRLLPGPSPTMDFLLPVPLLVSLSPGPTTLSLQNFLPLICGGWGAGEGFLPSSSLHFFTTSLSFLSRTFHSSSSRSLGASEAPCVPGIGLWPVFSHLFSFPDHWVSHFCHEVARLPVYQGI